MEHIQCLTARRWGEWKTSDGYFGSIVGKSPWNPGTCPKKRKKRFHCDCNPPSHHWSKYSCRTAIPLKSSAHKTIAGLVTNNRGHSFLQRWPLIVIPGVVYKGYPNIIMEFHKLLGQEMRALFYEGVSGPGRLVFIGACIGLKGDRVPHSKLREQRSCPRQELLSPVPWSGSRSCLGRSRKTTMLGSNLVFSARMGGWSPIATNSFWPTSTSSFLSHGSLPYGRGGLPKRHGWKFDFLDDWKRLLWFRWQLAIETFSCIRSLQVVLPCNKLMCSLKVFHESPVPVQVPKIISVEQHKR